MRFAQEANERAPGSRGAAEWSLARRSEYHRHICDLELELSRLRSELDELRSKVSVLESSREYFASLFEKAPVGYVILDALGKVQEYNEAFLRLIGKAGQSLTERYLGRFLAPGSIPRFLEHLHSAQCSAHAVGCELQFTIGRSTFPVELVSRLATEAGNSVDKQIVTMVIDRNKYFREQEVRAKKQSDFRALVDTIQGVVWEANPASLELTYLSPRAQQLLGYSLAYWQEGMTWESHVYAEDRERVSNAMRKLAADRKDCMIEYRMWTSDRRVIWVHNSMSAAKIGSRVRLFGVVIDVTDRKQVQEELSQARELLEHRVNERTAELRETVHDLEAFSYSLSHDLRAPLRAMEGYAQLLLTQLGPTLDESARTYFERLVAGAERLDRLIQDVLKLSQVSRAPVELRRVNLERLLNEIINDYPVLLRPKVRIEVQKPLLPIRGNEAFLTQCMSNLLANAVKFSRPGETPRIRISTEEPHHGKVRIWFEDNGIGIAPEDQRRIFGIFERVHSDQQYEGTGIGLAIVAKAAERMGGHVGVESALGRGSKFWLELPAAQV